jgi:dolichyl-phosphooligosaccharide-protein glycotransferase
VVEDIKIDSVEEKKEERLVDNSEKNNNDKIIESPKLEESKTKEPKTEEEKTEPVDQEDNEELSIDFKELKNKALGFFKGLNTNYKSKEKESKESKSQDKNEEEISFDMKKVSSFAKNNAKWLIPVALILIAMFASIYLRTMPLSMPITDDWAENTVNNFYQQQISNQINQQYPNLPEQNRQSLVAKEWAKQLNNNKDQIKFDIEQLSQQYKDIFRDEQGQLYLLGIDPYHYYRVTSNVLNYGHPGTIIKEGKSWDEFVLAPVGIKAEKEFHSYFGALLHRVINIFGDFPLIYTFFLIGTIFSALAVIPAFFIGKKITNNNVGGFFTALLVAVSSFFVSRTTGESSDTDVYVVFFPLLITWLFLEALEAKELKKKLAWSSLAGISTGLFSFAWSGWWYIFHFIIAATAIYLVYLIIINRKDVIKTLHSKEILHLVYFGLSYFLISSIMVNVFHSFQRYYEGLWGPLAFIQLKAVGITSLWPNILTTVAELNVIPLTSVIQQLGGKLLFTLAILGIILILIKKKDNKHNIKIGIYLVLWFIAALYATTKGVRFTLQVIPVFVISLGAFFGFSWVISYKWISKELNIGKFVTQVLVFVLLALLMVQPIKAGYDQAYASIPSMNDGWYDTLKKIDVEGDENAIINSWWDFGHWFKAIGNRPTTFDGAAQVKWGAHWMGKALLTNDEKLTAGILRMLNCGQNNAFNELDKLFNDTPKEIMILESIAVLNEKDAIKVLKDHGLTSEKTEKIITSTHCIAPTDYFITSEDMIGKSGVWGHFGSWNFNKAVMYQKTVGLTNKEGEDYLMSNFNMSLEEARDIHRQIKMTPADQWIAPWPSYISGLEQCYPTSQNQISCEVSTQQGIISLNINILTKEANIVTNDENNKIYPNSLVYATKEGVEEKVFKEENIGGFSVVLIPNKENNDQHQVILTSPLQAYSTFVKLFFFEGHGQKCFIPFDNVRQFNGGKISTWEVDYECKQKNRVFFIQEQAKVEEI